MSRIRTIKPDFFRHHEIYQAETETGLPLRVAYIGLWLVADREGLFRWRPEVLKLDVLPYDNVDFSRVLHALTTRGFLVRYEIAGKAYGWIPTFKSHQVINNREAASILPAPPEGTTIQNIQNLQPSDKIVNNDVCVTRDSRVGHASTTRHDLAQVEGEGEREGEKEEGRKAISSEPKKPGSEPPATPPVLVIPLMSKKGCPEKVFNVTQRMIDDWSADYPAVNVLQEIRNIRQWNMANPTRRKYEKGILRHINTWLMNEQNRGGTVNRTPGLMKGQSKTYEHNVAAISQAMLELKQEGVAR